MADASKTKRVFWRIVAALALVAVLACGPSPEEKAKRAAELETKRAALCTEKLDVSIAYDLHLYSARWTTAGGDAYLDVDPSEWNRLDWKARELVGAWASICKLGGASTIIRNNRTHAKLATYSHESGYQHEE